MTTVLVTDRDKKTNGSREQQHQVIMIPAEFAHIAGSLSKFLEDKTGGLAS
jgi:hypothetical protein